MQLPGGNRYQEALLRGEKKIEKRIRVPGKREMRECREKGEQRTREGSFLRTGRIVIKKGDKVLEGRCHSSKDEGKSIEFMKGETAPKKKKSGERGA